MASPPLGNAGTQVLALGPLKVVHNGVELVGFAQQRTRCGLLVFLADQGRARRESLCNMFWPDRELDRAKRLLSQMLYELKRAFGDGLVDAVGDEIVGGPSLSCDTRILESGGDDALAAYRGAFLTDFSIADSASFEAWADRRRAALARIHRKLRRNAVQRLIQDGDTDAALNIARAWVELDHYEDEAHHRVIELTYLTGSRSAAILHFEQYAQKLHEELEVEPLEETVALVNRIRSEAPPTVVTAADGERRRLLPLAWRKPALWSVFVVVTGIAALLGFRARTFKPVSVDLASAQEQLQPTRIAVLYFEDQTPDESMTYLAKGLTEGLINELARVDALSVISRNGVKPYATRSIPLDSISMALGVGTIIEGAVQRSGDSVRVSVQLVDTRSRRRIGGRVLVRRMDELFALQDDIASDVANFLRRRLGREVRLANTISGSNNLEAWRLYQEADAIREQLLDTRALSDPLQKTVARAEVARADAVLARAQNLDRDWLEPGVLRGWLTLDRATMAGYADTASFNSHVRAGLQYAGNALRRNAVNPAALELRGVLHRQLAWANPTMQQAKVWHDQAEKDLRKVVDLAPHRASAWEALSRLLQYDGRLDEAKLYAKRALSEDAYLREAANIHQRLFKLGWDSGDPGSARQWCLSGYRQFPSDVRFVECQLSIAAWYGDPQVTPDSAAKLLQAMRVLDPVAPGSDQRGYSSVYRLTLYAAILARAGDQQQALQLLDSLRTIASVYPSLGLAFPFDETHVLLALGDTARATRALHQYLALNPQYQDFIAGFPPFQSITAMPQPHPATTYRR